MEYLWYITEYDPKITRTKYNWNYFMDEPPKILLRESSLRRVYTVWFNLREILQQANLIYSEKKIRLDVPL